MWLAFVIIILFLYCAWYNGQRKDETSELPPRPRGIPLIGNPVFLFKMSHHIEKLTATYGGTFRLHLLHLTMIVISSYDDLKETFVNQVDVFSEKAIAMDSFMRKYHKESFLAASGPAWKEKRRFTIHHLRNFGFGKSKLENNIIAEFNRISSILDKHNGHKLAIKNIFFMPFLNTLWHMVAGKTYEYDDDKIKKFVNTLHDLFDSVADGMIVTSLPWLKHLPGDPFSYWKYIRTTQAMIDFAEETIDEHVKALQNANVVEPRDYIEGYLLEIEKHTGTELKDGNKCYQRKHLVGAVSDLAQGGTHTTTITLEFALLYMATWPEIQTKVQQELDTVIGRNRSPVFSDRAALPYVRATIQEVLRYTTLIPFAPGRYCNRTTKVGAYTIPKGAMVIPNFYSANFDEKYWGDPKVFRPERFIDENGKFKPSEMVLSFGIGSRNCIGESLVWMQLFIFFSSLLQRYSFHNATGETPPSLEPVIGVVREPKPFELVIRLR